VGLLDVFKKKKQQEDFHQGPNLMASDPAEGERVNLMAKDPINTAPTLENSFQEEPVADEEPGIENQLTQEPMTFSKPIIDVEEVVEEEAPPVQDAFSMSIATEEEKTEILEEPIIEKFEEVIEEIPSPLPEENVNQNKLCKICDTPNDPLNKFCVSCGNEVE